MAETNAKYRGRAKTGPNKGKLRVDIPRVNSKGKTVMKTYYFKNR